MPNLRMQHQGFTLVELILVLTIIALAGGAIVLSVGGGNQRLEVEQEMRLLADRFAATQVRAQALNTEIGFFFYQDQYYFAQVTEWQEDDAGQQQPVFTDPERRFSIAEGFVVQGAQDQQPLSLIFADGLYLPEFQIAFQLEDQQAQLKADGVNRPRFSWSQP